MTIVPKLGVGLAYQPALRGFIEDRRYAFDYLEVIPDIVWTDLGRGHSPRYVHDAESIAFLRRMRAGRPIIPHSIGLSIGSAHRFNKDHIRQIAVWKDLFGFPWHSDHLAYNLAEHGIDEMNVGVTIPVARDDEMLELLCSRINAVRAAIDAPFLLENNVYFFDIPGAQYTDAEFLNALCERTGCYLLLDLHNVYVNCRNHGTDPFELLEQIRSEHVLELHVAGGMEYQGFYLDAHSGPMPPTVWQLLERALACCSNVGGVTFELLGSWFEEMGGDRLEQELIGMKELWQHYQPLPQLGAYESTQLSVNVSPAYS